MVNKKENIKEEKVFKKTIAKDGEVFLLNKTGFTLCIEDSHIYLAFCEGGFSELGNDFRGNFEEIDFGFIDEFEFKNVKFSRAKKCGMYEDRVDIILNNPVLRICRTKENRLIIIGFSE